MAYYLSLFALILIYMHQWFIVAIIRKRNDVADVAWGLGFILIAWTAFFLRQSYSLTNILLNCLVSLWGLRLSVHILQRHRRESEDYRYQAWRTSWGKHFYLRSYLQVFLLQGVLLFIIAWPIMVVQKTAANFSWIHGIGTFVFALGFAIEAISDHQLQAFKRLGRRDIMQDGLWRYSRHPNYFGELMQWWGIWLFACSSLEGLVSVISPLTISFLIIKVSGIPLLEDRMKHRAGFADYCLRTNKIIIGPRKTLTMH